MSELLTQRIQDAATKLKRLHLAEMVDTLITRAQDGPGLTPQAPRPGAGGGAAGRSGARTAC